MSDKPQTVDVIAGTRAVVVLVRRPDGTEAAELQLDAAEARKLAAALDRAAAMLDGRGR